MPQDVKKPGGPEKPKVPEVEIEKGVEKVPEKVVERKEVEAEKPAEVSAPVAPTKEAAEAEPVKEKDDLTLKIEKVLEEDIEEIYFNMSPKEQKEFSKKGEETASAIRELMKSVKVKAKEIIKLIMDWLKIVPGVNKFFIEQEAKIKAEKIMGIRNPK